MSGDPDDETVDDRYRRRGRRRRSMIGRSTCATWSLALLAVVHLVLAVNSAARGLTLSYNDLQTARKVFAFESETSTSPRHDDPCYDFIAQAPAFGVFTTPNWPGKYTPNLRCIRTITAPANYTIELQFKGAVFEVEPQYKPDAALDVTKTDKHEHAICPADYVEIRDGKYGFSPLLARFCQLTHPYGTIRATSGHMWIYFKTDALLEYRGFTAMYRYVQNTRMIDAVENKPALPCHIHTQGRDDGMIDSTLMVAYQKLYARKNDVIDCVWTIRASPLLQVRIFMLHFALGIPNDCEENFLEVYAGSTAGNPMKRFCGMNAAAVRTGWRDAFIRIRATPAALKSLKIKMLYSSYTTSKNCSEHELFSCGDDTCIPDSLVCNGNRNCLYDKDEEDCEEEHIHVPRMKLHGPYLIILIIICSIIVSIIACAIVLNCCPSCKRRQQKYEEMRLRQSMNVANSAANFTKSENISTTANRRPKPAAFMPPTETDDDNDEELEDVLEISTDRPTPTVTRTRKPISWRVRAQEQEMPRFPLASPTYHQDARQLSARARNVRPPPAPSIHQQQYMNQNHSHSQPGTSSSGAYHSQQNQHHLEQHQPRPNRYEYQNGQLPHKRNAHHPAQHPILSPTDSRKMVTFGLTDDYEDAMEVDRDGEHIFLTPVHEHHARYRTTDTEPAGCYSEPTDLSKLTSAYQDERDEDLQELQLRNSSCWLADEAKRTPPRHARLVHQHRRPPYNTPQMRIIIPQSTRSRRLVSEQYPSYSQDDSDLDMISGAEGESMTTLVTRI